MKKGLLVSTLLLSVLLGVSTLNAVNNSVKVVKENFAKKVLSSDGANILNTINTEKSDLANGKVAIDIVIDNSKDIDVMYVIDNSSTMSGIKANVIDSLKTSANLLEGRNAVRQGVAVTTNNETTLNPLDITKIESNLNNVKTTTSSSNNGEIFDSLEKAAGELSSSNGTKVIILVVNNLGTLNEGDVTALKSKVESYTSSGIQIYAYNIDMTDKTNFNNIFSTATARVDVVSTNLNTLNAATVVESLMPRAKNNMETTVSFDSYIIDNFDIVEVKPTTGIANYADGKVTWKADTIESNKKETLSYYLKIKDVVDSTLVDKITLRTNRQVKVNGTTIIGNSSVTINDSYPADNLVDDQECSPQIMILGEKIVNPQTGIAEYIIAGSCMLAVALITLVILKSKNEFDRI